MWFQENLKLKSKKFKRPKSATAIFIFAAIMSALVLTVSPQQAEEKSTAEVTAKADSSDIEKRLEKILSGIKGAGNVEVMVVFKDDGREDIAMNREYSKDGEGSVKSGETAVMTSGRNAVIVQKNLPQVQGVIVTAEGAADEKVRENLKNAVAAALPVAYHRIEVLEMEYTE